jgi:hypothetical protein
MHFQLPHTLAAKVAEYDPALKPIIRAAKKEKADGSPRMSLGVPEGLFPVELFTTEEQKAYATSINEETEKDRAMTINNEKGFGLLVHKSSVWTALWFWHPNYLKQNPKDYLFGCTIAYKNTPATVQRAGGILQSSVGWKKKHSEVLRLADVCVTAERKYGRLGMIEHTVHVTTDLILKGFDAIPGENLLKGWGRTDYHKRQRYQDWKRLLRTSLGQWNDEGGMFTRIKENNDIRRCFWPDLENDDDRSFNEIATNWLLRHKCEKAKSALDTPFFRKELNKAFDECLKVYLDPGNDSRQAVKRPWAAFCHKFNVLTDFLQFYPDATLDHCQQVYNLTTHIERGPDASKATKDWIRNNTPIASFIQIMEKEVAKLTEEWAGNPRKVDYDRSSTTGLTTGRMRELEDTLGMLDQLHYAQTKKTGNYDENQPLELAKPNRWRITEFHDYVSAECFKLSTPNERLHQDLFPEPVRVDLSGQRWSFFQPQDVHQLAAWGRAVRNCVGNADTYRKGIKSKTHFIVLAMIDNVPRFTIQLKLSNGSLNVDQIADTCNRRLSDTEKSQYTEAFGMALQQLTPA